MHSFKDSKKGPDYAAALAFKLKQENKVLIIKERNKLSVFAKERANLKPYK